jgi:hypothetical protein
MIISDDVTRSIFRRFVEHEASFYLPGGQIPEDKAEGYQFVRLCLDEFLNPRHPQLPA